jgi:hypothetical protein
MRKTAYSRRLLRQFLRFASERKVYWIVPLIVILALIAILGAALESGGTLLLYTLF